MAALGRLVARRKHPSVYAPESVPARAAVDEAEALRQKLADQRLSAETVSEPDADPDVTSRTIDETLEERRARVHAKAREAIDAMGDDGPAA